jgi:hypothetical protein
LSANKHPTFQKVFGKIPCENRTGNSFVEPGILFVEPGILFVEPGNFKCENGKSAPQLCTALPYSRKREASTRSGAREKRKRGFPNH